MFDNVLGQEKVKNLLINQIKNAKPSHAYIFMGQNKVGRKLTAFEFAKILNCSVNDWKTNSVGACGKCSNCVKISKNIHPDIHLIDFAKQLEVNDKVTEKTKEIVIGTIRNYLQKEISIKAREAIWKFFIIDEAEKMNLPAFNALLKTLEEPPSNTIIILIASHKETIPQTVVSRSQILFFSPLKQSEITQYLIDKENYDPQKAARTAYLSEGSLFIDSSLDEYEKDRALNIFARLFEKNLYSCDILELSKSVKKEYGAPYIDLMIAKTKKDFRIRPAVFANILKLLFEARTMLLQNVNTNTVFDNLFFNIRKEIS